MGARAATVLAPARLRRVVPWFLLVLLSAALHLWVLDRRSFHHDEAVHAKLAYNLAERGVYRYDPTYHGPLLYYLTAVGYRLLGDSDLTARLPVALAGMGMVWVAWCLRRPWGRRSAWWTGLLLTLSPTFLFFGRFLRMDLLEVFTASGAFLAGCAVLRGQPRAWIPLGVWTGLAVATKENAYVTVALVGCTGAVLALARGARAAAVASLRWLAEHRFGALAALATFVLVTVPIFTVGLTRPGDWAFPIRAISFWWEQHSIGRIGGTWWFHLPLLAQYEFLPLAAATAWVVRRRRRLRTIERFLFTFGVLSIGCYAYLQERVPWLVVHQVWAFMPLAGAQLARTLGRRGRWWSRSLAVTGLLLTAAASWTASFVLEEITPAQRRVESLHFVQTSPELVTVARQGVARAQGQGETVASVTGEAVWPLAWYWRRLPVTWRAPEVGLRPPLAVCDPVDEAATSQALGPGYRRDRIPLRSWWLMSKRTPGLSEILRYLVRRLPWSQIGSTDVIVFTRPETDRAGRLEVRPPELLRREIGAARAEVIGEGWLGGVRGVAVRGRRVAAADASLSRVRVFEPGGEVLDVVVGGGFRRPEAAVWLSEAALLVADTWNHRVVRVELGSGAWSRLTEPHGGWYGPRALAVGPRGDVVVADTGNKRLVVFNQELEITHVLEDLAGGTRLDEPGGVAWVDADSILVCDTGHRRVLVLGLDGATEMEVRLPDAWESYYSRPQAVALTPSTFLVCDAPGSSLWLIEDGVGRRLDERGEMIPSGLGWDGDGQVLVVGDLEGRIWWLELGPL